MNFSDRFRAVRSSATNAAQSSNSDQSQRSRTKASSTQAFGDDHMGQRGQHRDVGAGLQRQVIGGLDMRRAHQIDAARIDDDQLRALRAGASSCARRTPDVRRSGSHR